jgi:hypothetical protein
LVEVHKKGKEKKDETAGGPKPLGPSAAPELAVGLKNP